MPRPVETIPIPRNRARNQEDFQVRVSDLHAWPGHEILAQFEYNPQMDRFIWELQDVQFGRFWPKGVATLEYTYDAWPYFMCRFVRTGGDPSAVTPRTLGRNVQLAIVPGRLGGSFHPDAEVSEAEERRLTSRRPYDPIRQ